MRKRIVNIAVLFCTLLLILTGNIKPVSASNQPGNNPESGKTCSLSVQLDYMDGSSKKPVSGASVSIYQVGQYSGNNSYSVVDEYADVKTIPFSEMSTSADSEKAARDYAQFIQNNSHAALSSGTTDSAGSVTFKELAGHGIYLVIQTGRQGDASKYTEFLPFLVLLPGNNDGVWEYDVSVYPKSEIVKEPAWPPEAATSTRKPPAASTTPTTPATPTTPTTPKGSTTPSKGAAVKTGDTTNVILWVVLLSGSGSLLVMLLLRRKKITIHS